MRLIDADALKKLIMPLGLSLTNKRSIITIIDNAPTVSPYKAIHDELHKGEEE